MTEKLTVDRCINHIEHTLGGDLSPALDPLQLINQAGEFFCSMHDWRWLEVTEAKLDLRGKVSISGGTTSSGAGTTLTKTGAFTNYTFLEGDTVEVVSGTSVVAGHHRVVSKTDANNLVLETTPGASGSAITATLHTHAVALPSDFAEMIAINTTSGLLKGVEMTSYADLLNKRAAAFSASSGFHYGAILNALDTDTSSSQNPVQRLEIWPEPLSNETGSLTMIYRASWKHVTTDAEKLRVPSWCHAMYLQILRAFARGYEEEDDGSLSARLMDVAQGPLFIAAVDRDSDSQPHYGALQNGAAQTAPVGTYFGNFNTVTGPS